jgi:uncharacterized protein (DUF1800 family)
MGNKNFTRRHFFRKIASPPTKNTDTQDDPLFQKYSRKKLTTRSYSTEEVQLKVGEEGNAAMQRNGTPVTSGLAPYTGTWTEWEVLHLLRRTNFGWKKAWVDALLPLTPSAAVDAVLNISNTPPAPPVNWYENISGYADESATTYNYNATDNPRIGYGADWTKHYFPTYIPNSNPLTAINPSGQNSNVHRMESLRRWLFGLTLNGDLTIREKMVWFWYHFIPVDFDAIYQSNNSYVFNNCARILYSYLKLFRDNSLTNNPGTTPSINFKDLIKKVALEPAMMYYLNNNANTKTAPDENFARELMELFTLGKDDPNNTYSQSDVVAAAKVLTGWRVENLNTANVATNFKTANHDYTTKTFSSFFNGQTISSVSPNGNTELDALINMIFSKQVEVSKYICRRLYRYFVYYDIDANTEANVITPLAQTFVSNNWNIGPVLSLLFKSQHFFDMANRGCYIKSPFDLVAGTLNAFAVNTTDNNTEYQYRIWSAYNDSYCFGMEQQMGSIPNVSGWNAYYQTPAFHEYWVNSNTAQKRFKFVADMVNSHTVSGVYTSGTTSRKFSIDTVAFAQQFGNTIAADPNALVAICIKFLLPIDISQAQKDAIKGRTLLYNQTTDGYWTTAWNTYVASPTSTNRKTVEDAMKRLISELTQLAEYQLM